MVYFYYDSQEQELTEQLKDKFEMNCKEINTYVRHDDYCGLIMPQDNMFRIFNPRKDEVIIRIPLDKIRAILMI